MLERGPQRAEENRRDDEGERSVHQAAGQLGPVAPVGDGESHFRGFRAHLERRVAR